MYMYDHICMFTSAYLASLKYPRSFGPASQFHVPSGAKSSSTGSTGSGGCTAAGGKGNDCGDCDWTRGKSTVKFTGKPTGNPRF